MQLQQMGRDDGCARWRPSAVHRGNNGDIDEGTCVTCVTCVDCVEDGTTTDDEDDEDDDDDEDADEDDAEIDEESDIIFLLRTC